MGGRSPIRRECLKMITVNALHRDGSRQKCGKRYQNAVFPVGRFPTFAGVTIAHDSGSKNRFVLEGERQRGAENGP